MKSFKSQLLCVSDCVPRLVSGVSASAAARALLSLSLSFSCVLCHVTLATTTLSQ